MIGTVIEGRFAGGSVHRHAEKNFLFIQAENGSRVPLTKNNVISIDDVSDQYSSYGSKVMLVMWNDFETSMIQLGAPSNIQNAVSNSSSSTTCAHNTSQHISSFSHKYNETHNEQKLGFINTLSKKNIYIIVAVILAVCIGFSVFLVSRKGSDNAIKSELMGTFVGGTNIFTRTINFRADGTFYEEHQSVLGLIQTTGSYKIKKDVILLTDSDGDIEEWSYSYNSDNGQLTLYYLDTAYVKYK